MRIICKRMMDRLQRCLKYWDRYLIYFGENLLWEIVSDAFGPNWENRFLPLSFQQKESFFYIYKYLNWVWWKELFLPFSCSEENIIRNQYNPNDLLAEKSDQAFFDKYLVWHLHIFLDQRNDEKMQLFN